MKRCHVSVVLWLLLLAFLVVTPGSEASWLDPAPTIKTFYTVALGRQPTAKELEGHLVNLEEHRQNLLQIITSIFDAKESQDRFKDLDPIETAYLKILGRTADGEGRDFHLKKLNEEKVPIEQIEADMANSDEGKKFAIRMLYMEFLNRDADEPGLDEKFKNPGAYTPWTKEAYSKTKNTLIYRCKSFPDIGKTLEGCYERNRFIGHELRTRELINSFYKNILGREPDLGGLRSKMKQWALGRSLFDIQMDFLTSEEFKKRKCDEVETAWLRHMLRSGEPAAMQKHRDRLKNNKDEVIDSIIKDLQWSDEGNNVVIRKLYWQTVNREPNSDELSSRAKQFKADGRGRDRLRDWHMDFLKCEEAKNYRKMTQIWKDIADLQVDAYDTTTQASLDFLKEIDTKFNDEKKEATKKIEELKKVAPAEFASMTYTLEKELAGIDLEKMKAEIAKINKLVEGLGPLLTGEVQKVFIQLLNRPAPDFYSDLNGKVPAWEGADKIPADAIPGGVPGNPPAAPPAKPAEIPGFEPNPNDKELLPILQKLLVEAKSADDLKAKVTAAIVSTKEFKDLEGMRKQAIVSAYQIALSRPPTEKELSDWIAKLNTGNVYITELQVALEKCEEYQKVKDALLTGKIFPFTADELTKSKADSQNAESAKSGNSYRLSAIEGFKDYDWAKDVVIENAVKTEDENGWCIVGDASVPLWKLKNVRVFAKSHPSSYGFRVYIAGAFFSNFGLHTLYDSSSGDEGNFLKTISMEQGCIIHSSAEVFLQMAALPANLQKEFNPIIGDSGIKSLRLPAGRNLVSRLKWGEGNATKHLMKVLPDSLKPALLQGNIPLNKKDLYLRALLPVFKASFFPKDSNQVEPAIEFAMSPSPSVGIRLSLDFKMPEKQPMTARVGFFVPLSESGAIQFAVNLDGDWKEPFGITGLTVGNLAFTAKITVPAMSPAFGFAGDIRFGQKIVRLAACIPASINFSSAAFRGSINAVGTEDLIALLREMGGKVDNIPFPADLVGLKDVDVSYSTTNDPVLGIPQGVAFKGLLCVKSDVVASVSAVVAKIMDRGIVIKGTVKKLKVGPLELSGAGVDQKAGTADDGATVDILFPWGKWHAFIDGETTIFGAGRATRILLDFRGLGFSDEFKIFNSWNSKVEAMGAFNIKDPNFTVKVEVKSDLAADLENAVDDVTGGHTPGFVKKIFSNLFALRRAGFEANLSEAVRKGQIPTFWIEFAVLGKSVNLKADINFSDVKAGLKALANKAGEHVDSRVKEFVKEYLKAIADFFKRLFGKRKGKIDDIMAKYKNTTDTYRDPEEEKLRNQAGELSMEYAVRDVIWSTGTHGNPGAKIQMQDDGNLVVVSKDGKPIWASDTGGKGNGPKLQMQDDGNLVIYNKDGKAIWATGTNNNAVGKYEAVMQADGNYVVYRK